MLYQILATTLKDLKILLKDPGGLATLFLMPAAFIVIMSVALSGAFSSGQDNPIEVLVVNDDTGAVGAQIIERLKSIEGFAIETEWQGVTLTRAQAESLIIDQTRNVAVVIPADFSQTIERVDAGTPARIELIVDPAMSSQFVGPVLGTLAGVSQQVSATAAVPRGIDIFLEQLGAGLGAPIPPELAATLREQALQGALSNAGAGSPVEVVQTQPAGMQVEKLPNVVQQSVPGYALFGVFFISQILASSILEEKKVGTFRRLMAAPMPHAVFLLGKLTPLLLLNLAQIGLMFAVGAFVMPLLGAPGLELGAHPEALIVISVGASLAANGLGLLLAALAKTAEQVGGLGSLLVVIMAALGGVMVPRYVMPEFMQNLGLVTPHAWALTAYQDVLVRGYGLEGIWPEFVALLGFAAVFFGIALWRFKWE